MTSYRQAVTNLQFIYIIKQTITQMMREQYYSLVILLLQTRILEL
nr:MAG TPA: hypothetical protein [Caudoviricetes sp.]